MAKLTPSNKQLLLIAAYKKDTETNNFPLFNLGFDPNYRHTSNLGGIIPLI